MKNRLSIVILLVLALSVPLRIGAATERPKILNDFFIVVDISGSMNQGSKMTNVKKYITDKVFGSLLKPGDYCVVIPFGDKASPSVSQYVSDEKEKKFVLDKINALQANQNYTDIGLALEELYKSLSESAHPNARQVILFFTDGKHTPGPGSPYSGKDIALDPKFKDIGTKIAQNGWYVYVVGLGESDAKKIADSIENSTYRNTDEKLSEVDFDEWFNTLVMAEFASVPQEGSKDIRFDLSLSTESKKEKMLYLTRVDYTIVDRSDVAVTGSVPVEKELRLILGKKEKLSVKLPYSRDFRKITFSFKADTKMNMQPSTFEWYYKNESPIAKMISTLLVPIVAACVLLFILLIRILRKMHITISSDSWVQPQDGPISVTLGALEKVTFNKGSCNIPLGILGDELFTLKRTLFGGLVYTGIKADFTVSTGSIKITKGNPVVNTNGKFNFNIDIK